MRQYPGTCPSCSTPLASEQYFCPGCGSVLKGGANQATQFTPQYGTPTPNFAMDTTWRTSPPPPPTGSFMSPQSFPQAPGGGYQSSLSGYQPPAYATAKKDASRSVMRQIGCGMLAAILIILALLGGAGWFAVHFFQSIASTRGTSTTTYNSSTNSAASSTGSNSDNGSNPASGQVAPTVTPVNATVTYAAVTYTILDTKQSNLFSDDKQSQGPDVKGVLRIDVKEVTSAQSATGYYYGDMWRLMLPNGSKVAPLNSPYINGPDANITRITWVDFPVAPLNSKQTSLQLGRDTESQIIVPLTTNPDVSKYQPKTITVNQQTQYGVMTWTITTVTMQLYYKNKAVDKGQAYLIIALKANNSSSQDFNAFWGDYIRLQTSDGTNSGPTDCTIPLGVPMGSSVSGNCVFQEPQGSASYTFVLLARPPSIPQQGTIPFQVH